MTKTNFSGFRGLDFKIWISHDFPGFPWPVRTLLSQAMGIKWLNTISLIHYGARTHLRILLQLTEDFTYHRDELWALKCQQMNQTFHLLCENVPILQTLHKVGCQFIILSFAFELALTRFVPSMKFFWIINARTRLFRLIQMHIQEYLTGCHFYMQCVIEAHMCGINFHMWLFKFVSEGSGSYSKVSWVKYWIMHFTCEWSSILTFDHMKWKFSKISKHWKYLQPEPFVSQNGLSSTLTRL